MATGCLLSQVTKRGTSFCLKVRLLSGKSTPSNCMLKSTSREDSHRRNYSSICVPQQYSMLGCQWRQVSPQSSILANQLRTEQLVLRRHSSYYIHNIAIQAAQDYLEYIHYITGLDWWAALVIATVPLRLGVSVLIQYLTRKNMVKIHDIETNWLPEISKQMMKELMDNKEDLERRGYKTDLDKRYLLMKSMQKFRRESYIAKRCHPMKSLAYMCLTLPVWISMTMGLRRMTGASVFSSITPCLCPSLAFEGALWFPDLLAADPFHILPVATIGMFLMSLEVNSVTPRLAELSDSQRKFSNFIEVVSRTWCLIALYLFWDMPAAMTLYWTISATTGLAITVAFKSPKVRALFHIPALPSDSQTPYNDMVEMMKKRYDIRRFINWIRNIETFKKRQTHGESNEKDKVNELDGLNKIDTEFSPDKKDIANELDVSDKKYRINDSSFKEDLTETVKKRQKKDMKG